MRTREGWELVQVSLPTELIEVIRVMAVMTKRTNGAVLSELAEAGRKVIGDGALRAPAKAPATVKQEKRTSTPKAKETKPKVKKETPKPDQVGPVWDQEKLKRVMEGSGLTGRTLAEKLESKNGTPPNKLQINRWVRGAEKIPSRYWSQLERLFGGGK